MGGDVCFDKAANVDIINGPDGETGGEKEGRSVEEVPIKARQRAL